MNRILLMVAATTVSSVAVFSTAVAQIQNASEVQSTLVKNLSYMESVYEAQYAPKEWKKKYLNWDLNTVYQDAVTAATALGKDGKPFDSKEVHEIVKKFIYSMHDYHVSVKFFGTEAASLPFTVKTAEGRVFLAYIDRAKLPVDSFPFNEGDEVITFDGKPVNDAINGVLNEITPNIPTTDRALADLYLTSRTATRGYLVPNGALNISILRQGETTPSTIQMVWDYTPERVNAFPMVSGRSVLTLKDIPTSPRVTNLKMKGAVDASPDADNLFQLGTKKSYIPTLGQKIWQSEASNDFYAYMYITEDRKIIGVVRIPQYEVDGDDYAKAVTDFAKIVNLFQATTDAMVIDQINNPGGSVFYLYALASMLTDHPLQAPRHRMALLQSDIQDAYQNLAGLDHVVDDATAKKILGPDMNGYPVSYQVAQFMKGYYNFMISQWNQGKTLTDPSYIAGADQLNPSQMAQYSKPILLVVNELCFSGGDFFPTTMQDNKRATIFGVRTAGAGGYVQDVTYPNLLGVQTFRVTGSIAERVDSNPIENLGVKPDVDYSLTAADLQTGFSGYAAAIKKSVEGMVKPASK